MRNPILIIIFLIINLGCSKEIDIKNLSHNTALKIQEGEINYLKKSFYSEEFFNSLDGIEKSLLIMKDSMLSLSVGAKASIAIDTIENSINHPLFPKENYEIYTCHIPIGSKDFSPIPKYFLILYYIKENRNFKLFKIALNPTKLPDKRPNKPIFKKTPLMEAIEIAKEDIKEFSFIYEGGYRNGNVFKRSRIENNDMNIYQSQIDTLLKLINESNIIKSQNENDTRRFSGNPEMNIVDFLMNNNYYWTIFRIVSEDDEKTSNINGDLEIRYYRYLNNASTYWVEVRDKEKVNMLFDYLCNTGENLKAKKK